MNVLIVCSGNAPQGETFLLERHQAFIVEQVQSVEKISNFQFDYFIISGRGIKGYLKAIPALRKKIKSGRYAVVHAHNGLSGLVANCQRKVPVVTTYHGSDINVRMLRMISCLPILFSAYNIFVSERQIRQVRIKRRHAVVPCGVDTAVFYPVDKESARKEMKLGRQDNLVLFSSSFTNAVKNYPLASDAVKRVRDTALIELKGYTRRDVNLLMNAADVALMTSFTEGSPQFVKEAMAANCPVVTTDVGDVREIIGDTHHCYVTEYDAETIAGIIRKLVSLKVRTNGRERMVKYSSSIIAEKIVDIYGQVKR